METDAGSCQIFMANIAIIRESAKGASYSKEISPGEVLRIRPFPVNIDMQFQFLRMVSKEDSTHGR